MTESLAKETENLIDKLRTATNACKECDFFDFPSLHCAQCIFYTGNKSWFKADKETK